MEEKGFVSCEPNANVRLQDSNVIVVKHLNRTVVLQFFILFAAVVVCRHRGDKSQNERKKLRN